ncbi:Adenosylmethionine-8-amino-7-oxononanoate aminotransferase [Verrucomicrobia bacterium]|nr:Adenosylmethionine-8-amino-7-oxononanoate aminotransferase [Verrucomicrobiota bacterium]
MHKLARLDHQYVWHPFTQMGDWLKREPIVIVEGHGSLVRDLRGREYLDANSSIWTNLHGHNHPKLNAALERQLKRIAHTSALGLANEPAALLARELVRAANVDPEHPQLSKVFFSDNGSTAMEVAVKMAYEFARRRRGRLKPRFLTLDGAYHGDTLGAVALGHIDLFHQSWSGLLFKTDKVMAPYCYRCPFNRARPERADARAYRKCHWECLGVLERRLARQQSTGNPYAAFVFEPLVQGAAGIIPQPRGWLGQATQIARAHGALLAADEVLTGFGRTGDPALPERAPANSSSLAARPTSETFGNPFKATAHRAVRQAGLGAPLFACHHEGVQPDFLAVAKGLTGGYLPMAATLTTEEVFEAFLGEYGEFKTFFHGHSFTGNPLGGSAALANLELLRSLPSLRARRVLEQTLETKLDTLWQHPHVGDLRRVGLIVGVELVRDWRTREPFDLRERAGIRVCEAMAERGVLTRPIGNVVVLMPPYSTTPQQAEKMVNALDEALRSLRRSFSPNRRR